MEFSKLNAPTLKELFVNELETMILSGQLELGSKLPSERELAERMQVSRAVVNAGIAELARKGFLNVKPRSGVVVADYRRQGTVETLLSIMKYNGGHLGRTEVKSILEFKLIVDKLAVELAVDEIEAADELLLQQKLEGIERQSAEPAAVADAAFDFYHEIAMISGNTLLPLIYRSFRIPVTHLWIRYIRKYGYETVFHNASAIFFALQTRDRGEAAQAVEAAVSASILGSREIYED